MIKFDVLNRFTRSVQFTADIACAEDEIRSVKIGLAIKWGIKNKADLRDADLSESYLRDANLIGADLSDANLIGADLSDANIIGADLSDANLRDANLRGAYLSEANLSDANLRGADLSDANLRGADLRGANLIGAYLIGAELSDANLRGANLSGADLSGADLIGAYLIGANLSGAVGDKVFIKSIQIDTWAITYTATHLQIGCKNHPIDDWLAFDDATINEMDEGMSLEWWKKWKEWLRDLVEVRSPAKPTGCKE